MRGQMIGASSFLHLLTESGACLTRRIGRCDQIENFHCEKLDNNVQTLMGLSELGLRMGMALRAGGTAGLETHGCPSSTSSSPRTSSTHTSPCSLRPRCLANHPLWRA
ncbi:hypothetical protein BS50DRAFT_103365 [Corynespora cassiicola Philippines]|uniref:Uncharacterized protein n=1 Tax=Corynespora cassiicola Philippines TaxID=1448308 RepID=A0A2T2NCD2_CORCC|nr:hypothetical protein BS50DRAFT_103365 [Corynespora cassiicola Philippines]